MATRRSPVEAVLTAIVTTLRSSTGVTGLATGGVHNNVPQNATFPYVEVTSPTDRRMDTFGRYGASVLVDVRAVSQARGDQEASRLLDQCIRTLDLQRPALSGHTALGLAWESSVRFSEVINAIVTRYHVATFRAWTEQSST